MATNKTVDWSRYPPDRVEGLKYFHKGPSSDEDGPPTDDELKMMCLKWDCRVDMKIDNFLFWHMRKMLLVKFESNHERFLRYIPKIFDQVERYAMRSYNQYQQDYAEKNKEYLRKCANWRRLELRRLRFLDKLAAICSTWSWSDDSSSEDSSNEEIDNKEVDSTIDSNSSVNTVIETRTRFAEYLETESFDLHASIYDNVANEEIVEEIVGDVNTQSFLPQTTSTQN